MTGRFMKQPDNLPVIIIIASLTVYIPYMFSLFIFNTALCMNQGKDNNH